jgi:5-formyltetrahydrofolate cyclo-ligase
MSIGSEVGTRRFIERALGRARRIVLPRVTAPPRHLAIHAVPDSSAT